MPNRAVFLDRAHTLTEDPGYISDPKAVKLLPGVELAIKSMSQAGYRMVVVTNQSAVARGLVTIETLESVHEEMCRQLADHDAELDAIYYCPYHPEGTVEPYARESDLRKPQPGMLLAASDELDIDLSTSWMVGDSPRDVEAGQRAGCHTIRVRSGASQGQGDGEIEDVQADYTVRNLVDAARIILRESEEPPSDTQDEPEAQQEAEDVPPSPVPPPPETSPLPPAERMSEQEVRQEILRHVRQMARAGEADDFSFTKVFGAIAQVLALLALLIVMWKMIGEQVAEATPWGLIAVVLQVMALTFFTIQRRS